MTNVLILGANGQLARNTPPVFSRGIVMLAFTPGLEIRRSLGMSRG